MKIKTIDIPAAGKWARDFELMSLSDEKSFTLYYHKAEDNTYWKLGCSLVIAYQVTDSEFVLGNYLLELPEEGVFVEITDSPWISEFGSYDAKILDKCKHYVFRFSDETVEVIAQRYSFEKLDERASIIF